MIVYRVELSFNWITEGKKKRHRVTDGPYIDNLLPEMLISESDKLNYKFYTDHFISFRHESSKNFKNSRCPSPYVDDKIVKYVNKSYYYYGFGNLEDLLSWFNNDIDSLFDAGFYVGVYETSDFIDGYRQCIFNGHKAILKDFIDLAELFFCNIR